MSERVPDIAIDNPINELSWHFCRECKTLNCLAIGGNGYADNDAPLSIRHCMKCGTYTRWLYLVDTNEWELVDVA